jgi:hypothetical protein
MSRGILTAVLALGFALAVLAEAPAQEPPPQLQPSPLRKPPTAEQLQAWVAELDGQEFLARETAMLQLIAAGQSAVPAVSEVFRGDSLEATSRALHVLQQIGLSPDLATQEAARAALVAAAASKENVVTARRATAALDKLIELRSAQALTELESLGAIVVRAQSFDGLVVENLVESVQLGPDFRGSDDDLRRLAWLSVGRIILVGDKVTDTWLKHAATINGLEELHLHSVAVTDEGLAAIASHPGLRQVGIYYTPLADPALAHFEALPVLSFVKLYGTKVSTEAVEKFQMTAGIPKVDIRKGAFLGVGCMSIDNECVLSTVHENSPAAKAGLAHDDVLVRFGQVKVTDFESLTAQIAKLDSGDEVEVEVRRDVEDEQGNFRTKNLVMKVKLGPWPVAAAVQNGWRP